MAGTSGINRHTILNSEIIAGLLFEMMDAKKVRLVSSQRKQAWLPTSECLSWTCALRCSIRPSEVIMILQLLTFSMGSSLLLQCKIEKNLGDDTAGTSFFLSTSRQGH